MVRPNDGTGTRFLSKLSAGMTFARNLAYMDDKGMVFTYSIQNWNPRIALLTVFYGIDLLFAISAHC